MEKNIFEGAKFGDKFLTRDGKIARYISYNATHYDEYRYLLLIEDKSIPYYYDKFGKHQVRERGKIYDIVSRY